jgi:hypothetical protein
MSERAQRVKAMTDAVGLVAVLLGLVFVGLELRGNTEAVVSGGRASSPIGGAGCSGGRRRVDWCWAAWMTR